MDKYNGQVIQVEQVEADGVVYGAWSFLFDWLEQVEPTLYSDKIPEGYRKLKDSSIEPRQLGDLRWSVSEKRYIEISGDEIGYANRDNWAACRKIEPAIKQSLTPEPPEGWRWLEVGEILRRGDTTDTIDQIPETWIGTKCVVKHVALRRNRFEVGQKVVDCRAGVIFTVQHFNEKHQIVFVDGVSAGIESKHLAPYIEVTVEVTGEVTGEVKNPQGCPDGYRFLELGEVIRNGDIPFENGQMYTLGLLMIGQTYQTHWKPIIRRNRFEVGEKVVHVQSKDILQVVDVTDRVRVVDGCGSVSYYWPEVLAPYIEVTGEVTREVTREVKPRFSRGERVRIVCPKGLLAGEAYKDPISKSTFYAHNYKAYLGKDGQIIGPSTTKSGLWEVIVYMRDHRQTIRLPEAMLHKVLS